MSFLSFSHVVITDDFVRHVVDGESEDSLGGHRSGLSRPGKTEFPSDWTREHIAAAIEAMLSQPEVVNFSGKRIFLQKTVRGVEIELKLIVKKRGLVPSACFPVGGVGVIRNVAGKKIPLDSYKDLDGE